MADESLYVVVTDSVIRNDGRLAPLKGRRFYLRQYEARRWGTCCLSGEKYGAGAQIGYAKVTDGDQTFYLEALVTAIGKQGDEKAAGQGYVRTNLATDMASYRIPDNRISEFQAQATTLFLTVFANLILESRAGGGKTTMLKHLASFRSQAKAYIYLAFNSKNAKEGRRKMPRGCTSSTTHSFMGGVIDEHLRRSEKVLNKDWVILDDIYPAMNNKKRKVVRRAAVKMVGLSKAFAVLPGQQDRIREVMEKYDFDLQDDEFDSAVGLCDEILGLSLPTSRYGAIWNYDDMLWWPVVLDMTLPHFHVALLDEVQDFNACQIWMVKKLLDAGGRVVAVGDPHQCVIDGTMIGTLAGDQAVERVNQGAAVMAAVGGGSLAAKTVTSVNRRQVENLPVVTIRTKSGKSLTTTLNHTHFAGYIREETTRFYAYLMYRDGLGYRVGITRNTRAGSKLGYNQRLNQERADAMWLLDAVSTETEARYLEQYYSAKYGLPTWVFEPESAGVMYTNTDAASLFASIDTAAAARRLLADKGMFLEFPHHRPRALSRNRSRSFVVTLCGDQRNQAMHRYAISGSDPDDAALLLGLGLNVRRSKRDGWRVESSVADAADIYRILETIRSRMEVNVFEKARFGDVTLPFTPTSHVLPGMQVFVGENGMVLLDEVSEVIRSNYTGTIHCLNVDRYVNYTANGIVTHNSLYRFRGASAEAFEELCQLLTDSERGAERVLLPVNYRSAKSIIRYVVENTHVKDIIAHDDAPEGEVRVDLTYDEILDILAAEETEVAV